MDDRRLKNLLIQSDRQIRIGFGAAGVSLVALFTFFALQFHVFAREMEVMVPFTSTPDFDRMVSETIRNAWIGFAIGAALFTGIVLALVLVLTHRIYGPMVPIRRHIAALRKGDYSHRTHLRKDDEFQDLAAELNALGEELASRSPRES